MTDSLNVLLEGDVFHCPPPQPLLSQTPSDFQPWDRGISYAQNGCMENELKISLNSEACQFDSPPPPPLIPHSACLLPRPSAPIYYDAAHFREVNQSPLCSLDGLLHGLGGGGG